MIVPIFVVLLYATVIESLLEGKSCSLQDGSPGVCIIINKCQPVLDLLLTGNTSITICEYEVERNDPIACCPTDPVTTTTTTTTTSTTTTTTTTTTAPDFETRMHNDGKGAIARTKCAEYSKYASVVRYPLSPFGKRKPVRYKKCPFEILPLISGGAKAEPMEFPHMAAVGWDLRDGGDGSIGWYCGGTLISETFVLTAAHCTFANGMGHASWVRVGDLNLVRSDDGASPVNHRIVQRIRHPDYIPPSQYHDIALLRLGSQVSFNAWIRPACLHTEPSTGTSKAIATGWGHITWIANAGSDDLLKVTLSLVDPQTCHARWTSRASGRQLSNGVNANWSLCAADDKKDTCQGDSGGPLVIYSKKEYYCMYDVVGVTSLGQACGTGFPGIYTRVYNYISWIESEVWGRG